MAEFWRNPQNKRHYVATAQSIFTAVYPFQ